MLIKTFISQKPPWRFLFLIPLSFFLLSNCVLKGFSHPLSPQDLGPIEPWESPVDQKVVLTQRFSPPYNKKHKGIDLAGYFKQPIFATNNGIVFYKSRAQGYGKVIIIQHSDGWSTLYAHLSKTHVKNHKVVHIGQLIGSMGKSGRATGVHLHFEIYKDQVRIDPLNLIPTEHIREK